MCICMGNGCMFKIDVGGIWLVGGYGYGWYCGLGNVFRCFAWERIQSYVLFEHGLRGCNRYMYILLPDHDMVEYIQKAG